MTTPNHLNPNGVSDGDTRVVPMQETLNANGGNDTPTQVANTTNSNVGVPGRVEPTGVEVRTTPNLTSTDANAVIVEDSVTHQAGDGLTTGMSPSMETPDIFDNSPQAAIKTQTADQQLVDDRHIQVIPNDQTVVVQQTTTTIAVPLETLSDGSVDIPREHSDQDRL